MVSIIGSFPIIVEEIGLVAFIYFIFTIIPFIVESLKAKKKRAMFVYLLVPIVLIFTIFIGEKLIDLILSLFVGI